MAGAAVAYLGWKWADPAAWVVIAALVCWSSWALLRESLSVLMEGTPPASTQTGYANHSPARPV